MTEFTPMCKYLNIPVHNRAKLSVAFASLWLVIGTPLAAQSGARRLVGIVRDTSGHAVPNAQLAIRGTSHVGLSDSLGSFVIKGIPAGKVRLSVRALGFYPSERALLLWPSTPTRVTVVLVPWKCASLECERIQVVPARADSGGH